MKRAAVPFILALIVAAAAAPARAESIVVSLSNHVVAITSSFVGEDLVLFGTVIQDAGSVERAGGYDIVVTVAGPRKSFRTRRKERVLGIWVNVDSREFVRVPAYLAVLSNRRVGEITSAERLRRLQLGLDNYILPQRIGVDLGDTARDDPFRLAFVKLEERERLYHEVPTAVVFLTPTVFRTAIPLPSEVPIGTYEIDVKLFADGALIGRTGTTFEITKVGFEQYVANAAQNHGLLYGLGTALLALLTGWFASVVFRRD